MSHPPCGFYKTTQPLEGVPAGRLVYFHNHGEPGAGIYLPRDWSLNRVRWHDRGVTVPDENWSSTLQPLANEGLYRVRERFSCCEKNCRWFEPGQLVQLGYNGDGESLLFTPEWTQQGLGFPERGSRIDADRAKKLEALLVPSAQNALPSAPGGMLH